ncbi:MAG: O-antigen polymerase, partial [Thermoleophilia bacterium]|nr:O-antigen polymerase [Thermoleophilia bacterium]
AMLAGWLAVVVAVAPSSVRDHLAPALAVLAAAIAVGWLVARLLHGREAWLLALGAAVLTARVPVPIGGGDDAMLLAPLYLVVGLSALVLIRTELRAAYGPVALRRTLDRGGATRMLDVGTYAVPAVAALSQLWTWDATGSAEALAFFLLPFPVLFAVVRAWAARGISLRPAAWALVTVGGVSAVLGLAQAVTLHVWWNPKVINSNRFRPDFRTNSLFWDPNIYGRALVVVLLAAVAWLLVSRAASRRHVVAAAVGIVVGVAALWHTYSQSSWFALAAALAVVAVLTLPPRPRRWTAAVLVLVAVVALPVSARDLAGDDASGRENVVRTGLALAGERPVRGWGVGSFESAATARAVERGDAEPGLLASHTTPVTVLAELGILGAAAYLALLAGAVAAILARWRRTSTPAAAARAAGVDPADPGWPDAPVVWAGAVIVALFAHSLLYAGFFEDATLWAALALLASLPVLSASPDHGAAPGYSDGDATGAERAAAVTSPT